MLARRLSIIGVGLLGGSIGMAVRAAQMGYQIRGYGHRRSTLEKALEVGAIDEAAKTVKAAVSDADLVILCTPVGVFENVLKEMAGGLKKGAVVTDVGSTKASVVRLAESLLPQGVHFVGSHPMAGSEKRGVEFARADLFQGAQCILTPTAKTDGGARKTVEKFWQRLGMRVMRLTPQEHDRLICDISHLPHAVAAAMVAMQSDEALKLAGKGFLDTTRVAGGDGGLWRDILRDNRQNVIDSVRRLSAKLDELLSLLDAGDDEKLRQWLDKAAAKREKLLAEKLKELHGE